MTRPGALPRHTVRKLHPDRAIRERATQQHGVIARDQLQALGLSEDAVEKRVTRGSLEPVYRGVYAVGHRAISMKARWMAAVLAAPEGAVLSHRAAAALWQIRQSEAIEVTVARGRSCRAEFLVHRLPLAPDEVTEEEGIPVTTIARTQFDLAAVLRPHQVDRAINEAEYQRRTDVLSLDDLVARYPRRRGAKTIRRILADARIGTTMTRNDFEAAFLAFLDDSGLPRPRANFHVAAGGRLHECDFVWPEPRVIVELDGYAAHGTRRAFEQDRAKTRALTVAGWRVIRVTPRQLDAGLEADLSALLLRRPGSAASR
jgi:Protein of unknown function (DUF559)/Transcriptional regulator, AbiEi antitoxin